MLIPQIKLIANFPKQHILFCYVTIMRRTFRLRTPLVQRQATLQGPHWRCSWPHRCLGHSSTTASWVKKTLLYICYIWDYMGLYGLYMGYTYIYMYGIFPLIYGIYIYIYIWNTPSSFSWTIPIGYGIKYGPKTSENQFLTGFHGDKNGDVSWAIFAKNGDALKR